MKLIQAMKKIKELQIKAEDLRSKVKQHCADLDYETPPYGNNQADTIKGWIQAHSDVLKEILALRMAIQRTNLATPVTIELGGKGVTKTIAEWIHRRRDLAKADLAMYSGLTDRGLQEGRLPPTHAGGEERQVKIRRYFDPETRDVAIELYRTEPTTIDSTLEVINAVTDLIEE